MPSLSAASVIGTLFSNPLQMLSCFSTIAAHSPDSQAMDNLPLPLTQPLRLQCGAFSNKEFTKFIPAASFRDSLWKALDRNHVKHHAGELANMLDMQSSIDAPIEDFLDPYRVKFFATKSFDFDGEVVFCGQKPRRARIHAAQCFKGAYFSVTFRCEEEDNNNEDSIKGRPGDHLSKILQPENALPAGEWTQSHLYKIVDGHISQKQASGLLLISGATGSGKTTCLNVLFALHVKRLLESHHARRRRPHFVVIGDPVETNCYEYKFRELTFGKYENAGDFQNGEARLPFDFTSRTLGLDVASVAKGLNDALRETPSAVVVSELRDDTDFRAALRFAATGHLIFATSHNTSLVDTFGKLLQVSGAHTPGKRAALIQRLLAVVHLREIDGERIPALWRSTPTAVTGFVAEGLSSLIAGGRVPKDDNRAVLGRYWMVEALQHCGYPLKNYQRAREEAMRLDLIGI